LQLTENTAQDSFPVLQGIFVPFVTLSSESRKSMKMFNPSRSTHGLGTLAPQAAFHHLGRNTPVMESQVRILSYLESAIHGFQASLKSLILEYLNPKSFRI
jgi:hypothetical protein